MDTNYHWKLVEPRFRLLNRFGKRMKDLKETLLVQPRL